MRQQAWHLKNCDLFLQLPEEEIRMIESRSLARIVDRGSPIYLPSDDCEGVLLLAKGRVKICHITPEGKQSILSFVDPGELFGELSVLGEGQRDDYAEAMEKSLVVLIPGNLMQDLMEKFSQISLGITKLIGLRRRRIERRLKHLLFQSNKERLVHLILELTENYGKATDQGTEIAIRLSHQELANLIGSTRESVTLLLGELQHTGLIKIARRRICVSDLTGLAKIVSVPPPEIRENAKPISGKFPGTSFQPSFRKN